MARLKTLLAEAAAALATLDEAVGKEPLSLIERDSAILRLIYTLAMVWKACRHLLAEREGIEVASPNATIRAARRLGWLSDEMRRPLSRPVVTVISRFKCIAQELATKLPSAWRAMPLC